MYRWRVICALWDLADEGVEAVLDLLQGELGATDIVVPLVTGPRRAWRRRPGAATRRINTSGGFHFKPDVRRYASCRVRPPVSEGAREHHFLVKLRGLCEERGLGFGVNVSASEIPALTAKHPELCARDVFGGTWPRLCSLNPETADFFRILAEEIRERFEPEFVEIEALIETPSADQGLAGFEGWSKTDLELFSICGCPACRQIGLLAKVDVGAFAEMAVRRLESLIQHQHDERDGDSPFADNDLVTQWVTAKREAYTGVITDLSRAAGCRMDLVTHVLAEEAGFQMVPCNPGMGGGAVIHSCVHHRSMPDLGSAASLSGLQGRGVQIPLFDGARPDGAWLNSTLVRLADGGIGPVDLVDFGGLPVAGQSALRQAIRFARRQ